MILTIPQFAQFSFLLLFLLNSLVGKLKILIKSAKDSEITRNRGFETDSIGVFKTATKMAATFNRKYQKVLKQQIILKLQRMIKLHKLMRVVKRMRLHHMNIKFNKKMNKKNLIKKLKNLKVKKKSQKLIGM